MHDGSEVARSTPIIKLDLGVGTGCRSFIHPGYRRDHLLGTRHAELILEI